MITPELTAKVAVEYKNDKNRTEIRQYFLEQGYLEQDVDEAIRQVERDALMQLPLASSFSRVMTKLETKSSQLSMKMTMAILLFVAFIILLIAIVIYTMLDPSGTKPLARDAQREVALKQMQDSIKKYYLANNKYPSSLEQLVPKYLQHMLVDPKTNEPYIYRSKDTNRNYDLCFNFEAQPVQCISPLPDNTIPIAIPNDSPSPTAVTGFTLYGYTYIDKNGNNIRENSEIGYSDAQIIITDDTKATICQVKSDANGAFTCQVPQPGNYSASIVIPDQYKITSPNPQTVVVDPTKQISAIAFGLVPIVVKLPVSVHTTPLSAM